MRTLRLPAIRAERRTEAAESETDLFERVLSQDHLAELDPAQRRLALRALASESHTDTSLAAAVELADAIDGFGPLTRHMGDPYVTDILVNAWDEVWLERGGRLIRSDVSFSGAQALYEFIERMLSLSGERADASRPIADARLSDGSRIHVVLPPVSPRGPTVSIRRFPDNPLELVDLVDTGLLRATDADSLATAVRRRTSIVISGGTGSGKTTLMNALLGCVEDDERIVLVEETPELRPSCAQFVRLVARAENLEGKGAIGLDRLVRAALRMRPDRIVVGEVRGAEALAAMAAMSVGHEGSMLTVHARDARGAIDRIASLAARGAGEATEAVVRRQVMDAVGLVVHLRRDEGRRVLSEILPLA